MSLGAAGGDHITPAVAEVIVNNLAFNDSLSQSIEKPRVYYAIKSGIPEIEGMLLLACSLFSKVPVLSPGNVSDP